MTNQTNDMSTIEDLYGSYTPPKGSGNFFSLEDRKSARVRFQSEPFVYRDEFKQPDGKIKISTRYAWLIWNHNEKRPQALKMSGTFYTSLATLVKNPDWGNPSEYDIEITRAGTGTDTIYTVNGARKNIDLDEDALTAIAGANLKEVVKEESLISLRAYLKNGQKFADEVDGNGDVVIRDFDEKADPLKDL
jgi:hypothetical protein